MKNLHSTFKLIFCVNLLISTLAHADVYPDTIHQRREPTIEEKQHLLHLGELGKGGCSASALTPEILITAEHCLPLYPNGQYNLNLAAGYFEFDPSQTFKITMVLDQSKKKKVPAILDVSSHYSNDLLIVKIKWNNGKAPSTLKYTREIILNESQLNFGSDAEASPLFTIGYPMDRDKKATYSSGYLKESEIILGSKSFIDPYTKKYLTDSLYLKVNIPLINGNSGGAVFTQNYKLVGTVHGGSPATETEKASAEYTSQNPKFWNRVAAIYYLYPKMKTLQTLFPNGINPNVSESGEWIGKP